LTGKNRSKNRSEVEMHHGLRRDRRNPFRKKAEKARSEEQAEKAASEEQGEEAPAASSPEKAVEDMSAEELDAALQRLKVERYKQEEAELRERRNPPQEPERRIVPNRELFGSRRRPWK
jgi:hypothetical protein